MTIKKFAFEVQAGLRQAHGIDLKRSHVHEVLAALFGFETYASLTNLQLLAQHDGRSPTNALDLGRAASRAFELGYAPPSPPIIAAEAARAAEAERLLVVALDDVLAELGIEDALAQPGDDDESTEKVSALQASDADEDWAARFEEPGPRLELESPVLRESLLRLADAGSPSAHLALAQLDEESIEFEPSGTSDGRYWFEQQRSGRDLTGVELEWAEAHRDRGRARLSRDQHLQRAAALGSAEAALRLAEESLTDDSFKLAVQVAGARHADRLGELALSAGRVGDARKWFRVAAERGDTGAMKTLASELEPDLKEAWTWVHLARLLGVNVMAYHAVGEDGLPADADEAGPIYAAGGFELDRLSAKDETEAMEAARRMHARLAAPT